VDSEQPVHGGRDILGAPKRLAQFEWRGTSHLSETDPA
jgi:hypothetical protein